jgi:hypothetical protein
MREFLLQDSVVQRHPAIQILPPCGMMSLKDLKEHHYTKRGGTKFPLEKRKKEGYKMILSYSHI